MKRRKLITLRCPQCGKEFSIAPYRTAIFDSVYCRVAYSRENALTVGGSPYGRRKSCLKKRKRIIG